MYFYKYVLCLALVGGYMEYSHAMNSENETQAVTQLQKKRDEEIVRIIRREEMPRMLEAIKNNDFLVLRICAEKLILANELETLDMALATAILCNNLHFVRYLVEVGFLNQKANVARTMMLLLESRGEQWYIGYQEGKPYCAVQKDIVHYLSQHFIIPF